MDFQDIPSPNHGPRRGGAVPRLILLHYTAMDTAAAAVARLCSAEHAVSSHYLIGPDGRIIRLVAEEARAWHAGQGAWGEIGDINSNSIGIELANDGATPFSEPQMTGLESLLDDLMARWRIPPRGVLGHSDVAPARKRDPGARFDWRRLAQGGRAVWPGAGLAQQPADMPRFTAAAARFGYRGAEMEVLRAFRLRFRPWGLEMPLQPADMAAIEDLARRHPWLDPEARDP